MNYFKISGKMKFSIIVAFIFILLVSLFSFSDRFMNLPYTEQKYEVDYNLLLELSGYYDEVECNPFRFIAYKFGKRKFINSYFEKEISRAKENYALIYCLKNIETRKDVKRFRHVFILRGTEFLAYNSNDGYGLDDVKFYIIVRRYSSIKKDQVFLLMTNPTRTTEPVLIIS